MRVPNLSRLSLHQPTSMPFALVQGSSLEETLNRNGVATVALDINAEEFERLAAASQELYKLPLYIDDTPALTRCQHGFHLVLLAEPGVGQALVDCVVPDGLVKLMNRTRTLAQGSTVTGNIQCA